MSDTRVCNKCGVEKNRVKDFYVSNQRACCKSCMPDAQKNIRHACTTCGYVRMISMVNLRNSKGQCRSCASKELSKRPDIVISKSISARAQVLRQGGVPNAKKFTKEYSGSNHYNWKGGITPEVMRVRNSEEQRTWRKLVFERDNYTCQECGVRGGKLCAHHLKSFSKYPDLRNELSNGQTLCYDCHRKTHNYGEKAKKEIV